MSKLQHHQERAAYWKGMYDQLLASREPSRLEIASKQLAAMLSNPISIEPRRKGDGGFTDIDNDWYAQKSLELADELIRQHNTTKGGE